MKKTKGKETGRKVGTARDRKLLKALGDVLRDARGGDARTVDSSAVRQGDIAEILGVSQNYLSRVERGLNKLHLHRILDVAEAYRIAPLALLSRFAAKLAKGK